MCASRLFIFLMFALACIRQASAAEPVTREDQFKAAYVINFLKFVEWPASTSEDVLTICFVGATGVHDTLASGIETKRAGARRLALRRIEPNTSVDGCNVLYVDASAASTVRLGTVGQQSILTISDAADFAQHTGMIQLFTDNNRLRFDINIDNAQKAGLRISSSLLQLAAQVRRETR
jgi:hypothetical protein